MSIEIKFFISLALIVGSSLAGYFARQTGLVREAAARGIMTQVSVVGYPVVGFIAIWQIPLHGAVAWLPLLGGLQATLMALLALWFGRRLLPDRAERGMVGFCCGIGNHGVTMAGFVIYLLFGNMGLGITTVYNIYTFFAFVLLSFTIAQAYAPDAPRCSIVRLLLKNLLNWRAAGLYACLVAILFSVCGLPVPDLVARLRVMDIAVCFVICGAYFGIGLRLHIPNMLGIGRAIGVMLVVRHLVGPLIGLSLAGLTWLTPWPVTGLALKVVLIQSSVPVGVMGVAVANMFHLRPQEASALFIVSSVVYLIFGIPVVMWLFG
ncbi:MAG: AEC family transporter [Kiritimatiellia bacterium]